MRLLKLLPCLLFLLLAACGGNDAAEARKTVEAFLAAAAAGDSKAAEACLLPAERARAKLNFAGDNPYKDEKYEVVKVETDRELAVITIKISGKQGPKGERKWVCVNEGGKWYFSPEKSAMAMQYDANKGSEPKKDAK